MGHFRKGGGRMLLEGDVFDCALDYAHQRFVADVFDGGLDCYVSRVGPRQGKNASNGFAGKLFGDPGRTSIRAGAGAYYTAFEQFSNYFETGDAPFGLTYFGPDLVYLESPFLNRFNHLQNPTQKFPFVTPTGGNVDWSQYLPIGGQNAFLPSNVIPYTEQYNFNVQR